MSNNKKQKAILIDLIHPRMLKSHAMDRMEELEELVNTYGGLVIVKAWQKRFMPHPKTYIGTGKVKQLAEEAEKLGVSLLIINAQLKPRQLFDISEVLRPFGVQVWDRIDLILKIFAKHAKTTEARLEIELASVRHMGPRIFGMGMELSRQGGGTGTRGLGETNTERMRRHLKEKERTIQTKLKKYESGRELVRSGRRRKGLKTVSLVGYTNAGKTTLLNALTGRKEYTADELFATLDTRVGHIWLPQAQEQVLLTDTIGFIKQLPPELLNAFTSTLSEAVEADLLLQVVDASDKNLFSHLTIVEDILKRLKIEQTPRLLVCNKLDQVTKKQKQKIDQVLEDRDHVWVSSVKKEGLEELIDKIEPIFGSLNR
jgi:GTPase